MNYKELLIKYIQYIIDAEGIDFITSGDQRRWFSDIEFSESEWLELEKLAKIANNDR